MKKQVINVLFFLRHQDPREPQWDMYETTRQQAAIAEEYGFPVTFLLEHDAMMDDRYPALLLEQKAKRGDRCEIGGWFEVTQSLVEKAGLVWRGRKGYSWDWHCHVGFSVGYTQEERCRLVDAYMADFMAAFGEYPKSVGSWAIDAYTLGYMAEMYGVVASCNCRDQWGTDGYTLWGGYYAQAYYPSRWNMLCPANSPETQISVPIFRMLGNDPIYQVDAKMEMAPEHLPDTCLRDCLTMEPVYSDPGGGCCPEFVDWFLRETFTPNTLSFNYLHIGQENAFDWSAQAKGTRYQFDKIREMVDAGALTLETLSQTGQWYRETYPVTPASSITAFTDWREKGYQSFWYNSRYYRMNLLRKDDALILRDLQLFRDTYRERYYETPCLSEAMTYDNLPVVDGNRWCGTDFRAGVCIGYKEADAFVPLSVRDIRVDYPDDTTMTITLDTAEGEAILCCREDSLTITGAANRPVTLQLTADASRMPAFRMEGNRLEYTHNQFVYSVSVDGGTWMPSANTCPWELTGIGDTVYLQLTDQA